MKCSARRSRPIPGVKPHHVTSKFSLANVSVACHVFSYQTGLVTWTRSLFGHVLRNLLGAMGRIWCSHIWRIQDISVGISREYVTKLRASKRRLGTFICGKILYMFKLILAPKNRSEFRETRFNQHAMKKYKFIDDVQYFLTVEYWILHEQVLW